MSDPTLTYLSSIVSVEGPDGQRVRLWAGEGRDYADRLSDQITEQFKALAGVCDFTICCEHVVREGAADV